VRFSREMWQEVGKNLRGNAHKWWESHKEALVGLSGTEAAAIALALKARNRVQAKKILAMTLTLDDWRIWRDDTTNTLRGIAARRAITMDALEDLGRWSARTVGMAILGALGL